MRCGQFREASSSGRDGEALGAHSAVLERHRRSCPGCASWVLADDALMRTLRMRAAEAAPDGLTERILSTVVLPGRILRRRIRRLQLVLASLSLSLAFVAAGAIASPSAPPADRQLGAAHLGIAVGLLLIAARPRRAAGGLAVLAPLVLIGSVAAIAARPGWGSASAVAGFALAAAVAAASVLSRVQSTFMPASATTERSKLPKAIQRPEAASA